MSDGFPYRFWPGIPTPRSWLLWLRVHLLGVWDVFADAAVNFDKNGDTNQAAAIALYSLLSFIPMFILTILTANEILGAYPHIQQQMVEILPGLAGKTIDPAATFDDLGFDSMEQAKCWSRRLKFWG